MAETDSVTRPVVRRNAFENVLSVVAQTFVWLLLSLVLAIIVEWIGMVYWWPELGLAHSERLYATETRYLETDLRQSLLTADPVQFAHAVAQHLHHYLFEATHVADFMRWESASPSSRDRGFTYHRVHQSLAPFVLAAMQTTHVFSIRLTILMLSLPAFALFGTVAMIDGLVRRDVRRWGGGRESAFVYHWAKRSGTPLLALSGVVYFASPYSVPPSGMILPVAAVFAFTVGVTASSFKKYL